VKNTVILALAVLSQYTGVTERWQTTRHDNSQTLQCNYKVSLCKDVWNMPHS